MDLGYLLLQTLTQKSHLMFSNATCISPPPLLLSFLENNWTPVSQALDTLPVPRRILSPRSLTLARLIILTARSQPFNSFRTATPVPTSPLLPPSSPKRWERATTPCCNSSRTCVWPSGPTRHHLLRPTQDIVLPTRQFRARATRTPTTRPRPRPRGGRRRGVLAVDIISKRTETPMTRSTSLDSMR